MSVSYHPLQIHFYPRNFKHSQAILVLKALHQQQSQ